MDNTKKTKLLSTSLLTSAFIVLSAPAFAQDAPPPPPPADTDLIDLSEDDTDEIVITGSRIRRDQFSAPSPIQVITSEAASLQGLLSASEILQGSSVAAGSGQINDTFTGFVVNGGAGVDTLSLRGLGSQRTLVLLNGRRVGPAGVSGTVGPVDLNIIPNSVVSRFEILKDGASSIYGSDAVAGVANVITKNNLDGFAVGATVNLTEDGGGETGSIWGSYGKSWDNLSVNISAEYQERKELNIGDRPGLACPEDLFFSEATGERSDAIDTRTGEFKCFNSLEGYIQTFFPSDAAFGVGGSFFGSRVPDPAGTNPIPGYRFIPFQERSYDDPRELETDAISPSNTITLFGEAVYTPANMGDAEVYLEGLYNRRKSSQENFRQVFPFIHQDSSANPINSSVFSGDFDYGPLFGLPPGIFIAPLDGLEVRPINLVPSNSRQEVNYLRGVAGIRGSFSTGNFFDGWGYDVNVIHSRSRADYFQDVIPEDRLAAGIGTDTRTREFIGVCGPTAPAGCVPYTGATSNDSLFDGNFSQAELDYFFVEEGADTSYNQTIIEGIITGDVFEAPAGSVGIALGVSHRRDSIDDTPGEFSIAGNSWGRTSAQRTKGSDNVSEIFGEIEIPLVANKPFFETLSFNGSARYSDYKSVGGATTYKAGLNWALNNTLRIRGTHGTSFRAPALFELFLANQTGFLSQVTVDPCIRYGVPGEDGNINTPAQVQANCALDGLPPDYAGAGGSAEITRGGGLGRLEPETSTANSIGFVFTPEGTGLSLAVDYFDIEINDQIGSFAAGVVGACYRDVDFRSVEGFCDLFTRELDPTAPNFGQITNIDASFRNIPTQTTAGLDIQARYEKEFNFGNLVIDGQATYTENERFELFDDDVVDSNGTAGDPKLVGVAQARFTRQDWTFAWTTNYTGGTDNLGFEGEDGSVNFFYSGPSRTITKVDKFVTHDFSIRKEWDTFELLVGARNIFDSQPSRISDGDDAGSAGRFGNYPFSSQYFNGYLGRQFFVRFDKTF